MNRFMLMITVVTATLLAATDGMAQSILYSPPPTSKHADATPLPFGQYLASRINDKDATKFSQWLASADLQGTVDISKGYTLFAVVNEAFDPNKPEFRPEHYIINDRAGIYTMQGNSDDLTALNGDKLTVTRTNGSYAVNGQRINGVIKHPDGTIYLIGGKVSAYDLF